MYSWLVEDIYKMNMNRPSFAYTENTEASVSLTFIAGIMQPFSQHARTERDKHTTISPVNSLAASIFT